MKSPACNIWIALPALLLLTCRTPEMKNEEEAIFSQAIEFQEAWNKGDAKLLASFFAEDAVRVGAFGDIQHGKTEIETAYDRQLHNSMPGASVKQEKGTVRMLSHDIAVRQGAIEIIPGPGAPSIKGYVIEIYKKVNGKWLILESHPKFFPPPPDTKRN